MLGSFLAVIPKVVALLTSSLLSFLSLLYELGNLASKGFEAGASFVCGYLEWHLLPLELLLVLHLAYGLIHS